jgi:hypothetical protein
MEICDHSHKPSAIRSGLVEFKKHEATPNQRIHPYESLSTFVLGEYFPWMEYFFLITLVVILLAVLQ